MARLRSEEPLRPDLPASSDVRRLPAIACDDELARYRAWAIAEGLDMSARSWGEFLRYESRKRRESR